MFRGRLEQDDVLRELANDMSARFGSAGQEHEEAQLKNNCRKTDRLRR